MSTLSTRKLLTLTALAALVATSSAAQARPLFGGGARPTVRAFSFPSHSGQYGNATFFRAPPRTLVTHSGQYGNATFLGGVKPRTFASHNGQYGNAVFFTRSYTFRSHNGQSGNVTFFGAPPRSLPSHNGQSGNVTFLGGVQPYTYPGHSGQVGNVTYFGYRPAGTVPTPTVATPGIVPTSTVPVQTTSPAVVRTPFGAVSSAKCRYTVNGLICH
jgi:hypothetical protein